MGCKDRADHGGLAGHDREESRRQSGTEREFRDGQAGEWGLRRWFDYHRASCRERRSDFPGDHRDGEIPRGDRRAEANGLLEHHDPFIREGACRISPSMRDRLAGEPQDIVRPVGHLGMRLGQRFPLLGGQDGGEIIGMSDEEVVPACEDSRAFRSGFALP